MNNDLHKTFQPLQSDISKSPDLSIVNLEYRGSSVEIFLAELVSSNKTEKIDIGGFELNGVRELIQHTEDGIWNVRFEAPVLFKIQEDWLSEDIPVFESNAEFRTYYSEKSELIQSLRKNPMTALVTKDLYHVVIFTVEFTIVCVCASLPDVKKQSPNSSRDV